MVLQGATESQPRRSEHSLDQGAPMKPCASHDWSATERRDETVLIVDDVTEVRDLCAELIQGLGLRVATAADGAQAKKLLAGQTFSLVVSDISMPGLDGLQLTRFIKKHYPALDVILMTAFNMRYSYDDVMAAGAVDFIQKPFSKEEFEAKIKRMLRERRQFQQIQRSEQNFRTVLENIPGVVFTVLPDGEIRFVDNKVEGLTGYSAEAVTRNPKIWASLSDNKVDSLAAEVLRFAPKNRRAVTREYLLRSRDGQRRWVQMRIQAVLTESGDVDHISGILLDITHTKLLEQRTGALNDLFLSLGTNHVANVRKVVEGARLLLNGSHALYYRGGDKQEAVSLMVNQTTTRAPEEGEVLGPLLDRIMAGPPEQALFLDRLGTTAGFKGDPLVSRYRWSACLGKALQVRGRVQGGFCVGFVDPCVTAPEDLAVFSMLAKALEIEEERRELHAALMRSEEKYRSLVDGNLYPMSIISSRGIVYYCNPVMASVFRAIDPAALIGRQFVEFFHPDDRQRLSDLIARLSGPHDALSQDGLRTGETSDFRALAEDGTIMDTRINLGPISYDGRPALQAVLEDVTGRRQTEQALKDSEERYRTLIEGANDAVFLESVTGQIVDVNTMACRILGYSRDELLRLNMADLLHRESEAKFPQGELTQQIEETMLRKDGMRVPVEVNTSILRLKGEKFHMSVVRDITLRKEKELRQRHLEQTILESKQRLMAVFDGIMSPLTITDLDYNIVMVNKMTASLFGETIRSLIGKKCYAAFRHGGEPCPNCPVAETIRTGQPSHRLGEHPVVNRTIEEYTYPIYDASGNLSLVINYGIDVTDKIKMQKQLLQADKMASLGTLAAGIAHEIRNPMATINLNTQILLRDLNLDQEHQVYMLDIQKEVRKIERIISEILEFSKPKPAHLVETSVNDVVQSVHEFIRVQLRKHGVQVHLDLDESPPFVLMDPAQVSQVLINLVINAMQAMPDGGVLTITTRQDRKNKRVELFVVDTGVGIPQENIDKVFDPFFTNKPEGTGLGLSIARQLLEKNQATMQVESTVGEGTTFSLRFKAVG
jgi:PAS domain S-box-containing protein